MMNGAIAAKLQNNLIILFLKALIIHQVSTKKIMTVTVFGYLMGILGHGHVAQHLL